MRARGIGRLFGVILLGAAIMGATVEQAPGDEKKRNPDPTRDESYTEKVAVRRFEGGKLAMGVVKDVPAFRVEKEGVLRFYTKSRPAATPTVGTEFTDEKGNTFVVTKVSEGTTNFLSTVKAK